MQDRVAKSPKRARLVRKQVMITPEQNRRLKAHAKASGRPEAELIRALLERELGRAVTDDADWKHRLLSAAGSLSDGEADALEATVRENRAQWQKRAEATARRLRGES